MPELRVALRLQHQFVQAQPVALRGGADEALVEGDVRAQAGDLLIALGQRALQVGIGLPADLVGAGQGGDLLLQFLDPVALVAQALAGIGRAAGRNCATRPSRRTPPTPAPAAAGPCADGRCRAGAAGHAESTSAWYRTASEPASSRSAV
jgi:hypothetical protein